jgi:hypothetical protein
MTHREQFKRWTERIAEADSRPWHPEDYKEQANQIMAMPDPEASWQRITANRENTAMHTDFRYSFLDWFEYEIEGGQHHPSALSGPIKGSH